jgi:hypothetical protein
MIPSTNTKLLVAEDWKKIYQSFRNADFQSYDFETLRRTMIQYLRENYPEDFNDFIDSSEYVALIDLIAYLGQNLSFRVDLNARENFLETAERRDSVLRLAQLISYVPKRNVPSSGFLKLVGISTTDSVVDANRINLANTTISWNDSTNADWYQQFITVINSAMPGSFVFGKPYDRGTVDGIFTEQYRINSANADVPVFSFLKNINGANMNFEVTSCTFSGASSVYEEPPAPGNAFSLIFKNDNQGFGSSNTGFFTHFRQGTLGLASFSITNPVPNEIIGVNTGNINDTDVWLWQLDGNANYSTLWNKISAVTGNNVIYNSLNKNERNIYSVTSRDSDQIDLNFADGAFGNLPKGEFRLLYRQSNGAEYSIKPEQMNGIIVQIPYINKIGQSHSLSLTLSLQYTVSNSSTTESNASIKNKAPQVYYTQNRMVTAEDYNIAPLTLSNDILKVKSVNRVTSGISKYFDLSDVSSKYGQTNIFATDGILYKNSYEEYFDFEFTNSNEVYSVVKERLGPIVSSTAMRSFYLDNFERFTFVDLNLQWRQITKTSGQCSGYFETQPTTVPSSPQSVGSFTTNNLKYVSVGSLIKFLNLDNTVTWATVIRVVNDGSNGGTGALSDGTGPIVLSTVVSSTAQLIEVIPKYKSAYSFAFENELVNLCQTQRNFGLTINNTTREWSIILDTNLNSFGSFDLFKQGDRTNTQQDSSWIVCFNWNGKGYRVRYRITDYIFESEQQTAFYIDSDNINYDYETNTVIKDKITVLSINTATGIAPVVSLGKDYLWQVDSSIIESDGYVEPKKVKISFYDYNNSGQIEDPDTFENVIGTGTNYVFFKTISANSRTELSNDNIITTSTQTSVSPEPDDGQLYYFSDPAEKVVKRYSTATLSWTYQPEYSAYLGRSNIKFQYIHNSGETRRVDPSKSNIMDVYLLTNRYDLDFRTWLTNGTGTEPLAPTSQSLEQNYASSLENIKTISDEIVFHPVKYKVLFGSKADINLQATFKAVKNSAIPISDNEIKTRILESINNFFALENWEFGQSFYFSELSTYIMNEVSPYITNFVVVPKINNFGSLYEVACLSNEILISGATVNDIQVINAITASQLNTTATIVTSSGS